MEASHTTLIISLIAKNQILHIYYSNNVIYLVDQMLHVIFHGLLYSLYHPEELCPPKKKVTNLVRYTFLTFFVRPRVFFQITFKISAF